MIISKIGLINWRNFADAEVDLTDRVFVVGPNAAGKSNFLDAFKFLRDISLPRGGLQEAINQRGGISKIRCLAARTRTEVGITVELRSPGKETFDWKYSLGIKIEVRGAREPYVAYERVWKDGEFDPIMSRPNEEDTRDPKRRTQTYLEQVSTNSAFREIADFFQSIQYLHLVPQLIKFPDAFRGKKLSGDPFGMDFLESVAKATIKTRNARLRRIEGALAQVVPHFRGLEYRPDMITGVPHLQVKFEHWRGTASNQREDQFSDGTLRLIGLLWSLLSGDSLLLLEEPELSLHTGIVRQLAPLIHKLQQLKSGKRQVVLSTHSEALLANSSIDPSEVIMLLPGPGGNTKVRTASSDRDVGALLGGGMNIADAVMPKTVARDAYQLLMKFG